MVANFKVLKNKVICLKKKKKNADVLKMLLRRWKLLEFLTVIRCCVTSNLKPNGLKQQTLILSQLLMSTESNSVLRVSICFWVSVML